MVVRADPLGWQHRLLALNKIVQIIWNGLLADDIYEGSCAMITISLTLRISCAQGRSAR